MTGSRSNGSEWIYGPWERPRNLVSNRVGSIHDPEAARRLGFSGAIVSGRAHLGTFVPLLVDLFGMRWFEQGTISVDFLVGTLDQEEVRAGLGKPPPDGASVQVEARLERPSGEIVSRGTASVGDVAEPTWVGRKKLDAYDAEPYDLVRAVRPGDTFPRVEVTLRQRQAEFFAESTVALPWYTERSAWGAPIASPFLMVNAMGAGCVAYLREHGIRGVAIDGATELRNVNGPVLVGPTYWASGRVLARGHSPRTEYFWYEGWLDDDDGLRIAEMVLQWRCLKGSA